MYINILWKVIYGIRAAHFNAFALVESLLWTTVTYVLMFIYIRYNASES